MSSLVHPHNLRNGVSVVAVGGAPVVQGANGVPAVVGVAPHGAAQHRPPGGGGGGGVDSCGGSAASTEDPEEEEAGQRQQQPEEEEESPEIDIVINNVVCSFSVRCHLNLRDIALRGVNVEYRKENGVVTMKLRHPYTTASMWSSGKITCTGANSEDQAHVAARRYARVLQKLGFNTRFRNYRVVNVLGTCTLPFAIKITQFSQKYRDRASYEPELHPGVTYKLRDPKATLKIFSTGSITVTAPSVSNVQMAIEHIYPLVHEFRKPKTKEDREKEQLKLQKRARGGAGGGGPAHAHNSKKRKPNPLQPAGDDDDDDDSSSDDDY